MKLFIVIFSVIFIVNNISASQKKINMFDSLPFEITVRILRYTVGNLSVLVTSNRDLSLSKVSLRFHDAMVELIKEHYSYDNKKMGKKLVLKLSRMPRNIFKNFARSSLRRISSSKILLASLLIDAGADLDEKNRFGDTPLVLACHRFPEIVPALINAGADVNYRVTSGWTLLMIACKHQPNIVLSLINGGADIDAQTSANSPVMIACQEGNLEVVKVLVGAGVNVNVHDFLGGLTPLMYACKFWPEIILLLINKGANINAVNNLGQTSLMIACQQQQFESVEKLLGVGAATDVCDNNGWTLLMYACKFFPEALSLFTEAKEVEAGGVQKKFVSDYSFMDGDCEYGNWRFE